MIATATYDFSNLKEKFGMMQFALAGDGANEGQLQSMLRVETGQLFGAIGDAVGPATREKALKRVEWDVKKHLTIAPEYINSKFNDGRVQESAAYADFTWLTAGNGKNGKFLLGINNEDLQTSASGSQAMAFLRAGQKAQDRGDAYIRLGQRGQSKKNGGSGRINILRLNRVKVSKAAYRSVMQTLDKTTGELRAAFYRIAKNYAPKIRVPGWLSKKFAQVEQNGKSAFNDTLTPGNATGFIEGIIRAPGVTSNPALAAKIQNASQNRAEVIFAKFKKIISGMKYNFETGQVYRPKAEEEYQ